MKEKIIITLLTCILLFLLARLATNSSSQEEFGVLSNTDYKISNQLLAKLENDMVREKILSDDGSLHYMELYPELYVESVKPIIHIKEKKLAYLTFDDGPSQITEEILETLKEENVKATFFIIGCTITEDEKEVLKKMIKEGHTIGIHTYSHDYKKIYSSVEAYLEDFYQAYQLIYEITGVQPKIFRFPWGSANGYNKHIKKELVAEMERRGFTFYDWTVSAEDSIGKPTEYRILYNIMKDLERKKNPIILLHDASVNKLTAQTLPKIIEVIREQEYEFDTLDHREPYQF